MPTPPLLVGKIKYNKMAQEKIFADGFIFKKKPESPEFVIGNMSVKVDDAISFLKQNESNGWVNLNIMLSQSGKHYVELDTWKPTPKAENVKIENEVEPDLPF
jgi:hypothetical protein